MKPYYKQFIYIGIAFAALLLASFFLFQIESQTAEFKIYPEFKDGTRGVIRDISFAIIAFILYLLCLSIWWNSIRIRVIQRGVRLYLFLIHSIMLFYMTHYFLITSIYDTNIYLLRVSGYFVCIPFFFIPICGYYASLHIGKENVKFTWKEYILLVPAIVFSVLFLTSEYHSLLFIRIPGEKQPNLQFHTTILTGFVFVWVLLLETMKSWHIYKISGGAKRLVFFKWVPFIIVILDGLYILPIYLKSLVVKYEVIESMASFFLMEILVWESCIAVGMLQVNNYHKEVFDISTVSMQITNARGEVFRSSKNAAPITKIEFEKLKSDNVIYENDITEKYISKLSKGYLIWQKDVRELNYYIRELIELQKKLHDEVEITKLESDVRAEQAKIQERQRIYIALRFELAKQSEFVENSLKNLSSKNNKEVRDCLGKLILVATYIKRFSNLYLLSESDKRICAGELRLCFSEINQVLYELNISGEFVSNLSDNKRISSKFCVNCCKIWEYIIEYLDFKASEVLFLLNHDQKRGREGCNFIISIIKENISEKEGFKEYFCNISGEKIVGDISVYETDEGMVVELDNEL